MNKVNGMKKILICGLEQNVSEPKQCINGSASFSSYAGLGGMSEFFESFYLTYIIYDFNS